MGLYSDKEIIKSIMETNYVINRDIVRFENISNKYPKKKDKNTTLFYSTLESAWLTFISIINNNPQHLDENTGFNQDNILSHMEFSVNDYKKDKLDFLSTLLRVLYEYYFWTGHRSVIASNFITDSTLTLLENAFEKDGNNLQFSWIRDKLSISIMKWLLNNDKLTDARRFISDLDSNKQKVIDDISSNLDAAINKINNDTEASILLISTNYDDIKKAIVDGKLEAESNLKYVKESIDEIKALEERVRNLKSEYNFVGLSSGFNRIKEKKEKELSTTEMNYKNLFGTIFIAPVIAVIIHFTFPELYPKDYSAIFILFPFITIEMAIIYFFRLSYLEAKALRTQLMQIDLRLSLCAFIDGYVEYRRKNDIAIEKVLDSFDALIFSPIQTNENNIPAMFDGLEAIAGVAEKVMKK
ncbi:hypothetical protein [Citrobacter portucalensis]|uniref:hypothetical protein n=1 Tax=Citrobacter portucalensis TaxID=1639133 RepID=UPI003C2E21F1